MEKVLAEVFSNKEIMPGAYLAWLEAPQLAGEVRPGQFVMVHCGEDLEMFLPRPLSIHQRDGSKIALLFYVVGKGTDWLSQCQAGSSLELLGSLGNGFSISPDSRKDAR